MKLAILGPTASGKSALAVEVAKRLGGTVVNGDPFQALRGLAIGTGQPGQQERSGIPHLGYGELELSSRPNPGSFARLVRAWLEESRAPVLVTGSGLYLRGIWGQMSDIPEVSEAQVQRVRRWGATLGAPGLHRFLRAVDRDRAGALHPNDRSRIQRALALHLATGGRPSELLSGVARRLPEGWRAILVLPAREAQRERVRRRVRSQVLAGWPREVEVLLAQGHGPDLEALRPLGYLDWMGGGNPEEIEARIVAATQVYAKRQGTYFRNQWAGIPTWDPDKESLEIAFDRLKL